MQFAAPFLAVIINAVWPCASRADGSLDGDRATIASTSSPLLAAAMCKAVLPLALIAARVDKRKQRMNGFDVAYFSGRHPWRVALAIELPGRVRVGEVFHSIRFIADRAKKILCALDRFRKRASPVSWIG